MAKNNTPTYTGNPLGEVFGWAVSFLTMIFGLFWLFPVFAFLLTMLKSNNILKGIALLVISVMSGIRGISFSYGKNGYIADHGGGVLFAVVIMVLIIWGLLYFPPFHRIIIHPSLLYFRYYRRSKFKNKTTK